MKTWSLRRPEPPKTQRPRSFCRNTCKQTHLSPLSAPWHQLRVGEVVSHHKTPMAGLNFINYCALNNAVFGRTFALTAFPKTLVQPGTSVPLPSNTTKIIERRRDQIEDTERGPHQVSRQALELLPSLVELSEHLAEASDRGDQVRARAPRHGPLGSFVCN